MIAPDASKKVGFDGRANWKRKNLIKFVKTY
nr:MAG TPA: hypothetical protein [Bacteriophage sp.]